MKNPELMTLSVVASFSRTTEREPRHYTSPEHTGEADYIYAHSA